MLRSHRFVLILLVALSVCPTLAGENAPTVEDLAWLQGAWLGEGLGGTVEEIWSAPRNGVMVGSFRLIKQEHVFFELLTIAEHDGEIQMRVKHFHPDMTAWEDKEDFVTFRLESVVDGVADFGGLVIRHPDPDRLEMELAMRRKDGVTTERFSFRRIPLAP